MNKKEKKEQSNKRVQEILEELDGIQFLGFSDTFLPHFPYPEEAELYKILAQNAEYNKPDVIVEWIKEIIKNEAIFPEILLMWSDRSEILHQDWARIIIDEKLNWLDTIWKRSHEIYFLSLDNKIMWEVYWQEDKYLIKRSILKNNDEKIGSDEGRD